MNETQNNHPDSHNGSNPPFGFTRWEVFQPLRQHAYFICLFTISAMLAAFAITYLYDEKYEAQVTLLLKPTEVTRLKQHTNESQALGASMPQQVDFKVIEQTLTDLSESEPLLRRVVTKLHLDVESRDYSDYPLFERWYYELKDWVSDSAGDLWSILKYGRVIPKNPTNEEIAKLQKDVTVDSQDSYVFVLKVRDKGARRAPIIANEIAHEMATTQRATAQGPAQARVVELRDRLQRKYEEIQVDEKQIQELLNTANTASIQEELDKEESQYASLKSSWLVALSDISQQKAIIQAYKSKLKNIGMAPGPGEQRLQADDYRRMISEELAAEVALAGLDEKARSLSNSMEALQQRMRRLPELQVEYDLLDHNRSRAQRDYLDINDALQEEILQEQSDLTALVVAAPAAFTDKPKTPIKIYHVGLAAGLGLLLALGMAFTFGYFDIRFFMTPPEPEEQRPPREPLPTTARPLAPALD